MNAKEFLEGLSESELREAIDFAVERHGQLEFERLNRAAEALLKAIQVFNEETRGRGFITDSEGNFFIHTNDITISEIGW